VYILLLRISPEQVRKFKLASMVNRQIVQPETGRTYIVHPTNVNFDCGGVLGLGANDPVAC
jgi:hypothetical protein